MKNFIYPFIFTLLSISGFAQDINDSTVSKSPFQITFVTPVGTNGLYSYKISNQFSFNILVGVNGGVDGFELGGIMNTIRGDVKGAQIAGIGNLVTGNVNAAQISGFFNINGGYTEGLQIAGFTNIVGGNCKAMQLAGFGNICGHSEVGQLSGFGNISGNTTGIQLGGFGNISENIKGAQVSGFMNIAENVEGFQGAGFMNIAENVKGVQVAGFLNIIDSIDGIPIAPVSIVKKNGYMKFEAWTNEIFFINASFKIGVQKFYTIYNLGYKPGLFDYNWTFGYGAGSSFSLGENSTIDPQFTVSHYFKNLWESYNQLNTLKLHYTYHLGNKFAVFAGPSFNILVTDFEEYADKIAPSWAFKFTTWDVYRGWVGFNAGIRFL